MSDIAPVESPDEIIEHSASDVHVESRSLAVRQLAAGSGAAIGVVALAASLSIFSFPVLPVALGVVSLMATASYKLGRAARHFLRYGSPASALGVTAGAVGGLSLATLNALLVLQFFGASIPSLLVGLLGGIAWSGILIAVAVVLRTMLGMFTDEKVAN